MATLMSELNYASSPVPIRKDLEASHRRAWKRIAEPGTWLTGARRIAIAAETRNAPDCALCRERKDALSPYSVEGSHDSLGDLPDDTVEVIHRISSDPGRLMERWYREILDGGMADTEYVETVGVVVTMVSVDTFARSVGMTPPPLPEAVAGEPTRHRPVGARHGGAWVPWVTAEDRGPEEHAAGLYADGPAANIRRALSLVPAEAVGFFDLVGNQYLAGPQMRDFSREFRAITHGQIELIAARISALNQCLY